MYILKSQQPSFVNNQLLFQQHKCCVIIPTYNNGRTLKRMVESVLEHCRDVIVVNDGATDETSIILEEFDDQIHLLTHERNLGKGKAIRNGFTKAVDLGFEFAITIDSDGQHFAENLPDLLQESVAHPKAVIMGARNMDQDGIPSKSSFGNKFSNFWSILKLALNCRIRKLALDFIHFPLYLDENISPISLNLRLR